ncbi:XRE family transcriptional regulator [Micromonospora sp. RTGN7]|uniref:XRE family transcriptional regulator n=1 Tax=Micromonospora sp. RTGN7 TaxID=3016526 RepID=UPI0029FEE43A|nr:XRE family transcriptional regulator [Micromonospora sp. RTGN7]
MDKVERGLRTLDRLSVLETVAAVLGVAPEVLLARETRRGELVAGIAAAVKQLRAALACYHTPGPGEAGWRPPLPLEELDRRVTYVWMAYRHAHHSQVLRMLPDLLADAHQARDHGAPTGSARAADLLVRTYRLAAQMLVKLGEAHLAWLATDRAMATAAGDPRRTAIATIPLVQALRALEEGRLAMIAATTAVRRLTPYPSHAFPPDHLALAGTLLVEAALAAAGTDSAAARNLIDHATHLAEVHGNRPDHDNNDIEYGPTVVALARALITADLGDPHQAAIIHKHTANGDAWNRLPAEHRAAHLIDIARIHLDSGNPRAAGRALVTADRIAAAETRIRPAARAVLTALLRDGPADADVTRLAAIIGLTHP